MTTTKDAFDVLFTAEPRVAGDTVHGKVVLNYPLLRLYKFEEVHVNIRGEVITQVGTCKKEIHLFRNIAGIWKKSDPAPVDEHISSKDFSFVLPVVDLPPAGLYGHETLLQCVYPAAVSYIVEGVGVRANSAEVMIRRPFSLMPSHKQGAELSKTLQDGWAGEWRVFDQTKASSKGKGRWTLGASKDLAVNVTLSVPDMAVYPIHTPIPYQLHLEVLSTSKKGTPPTASASSLVGVEMSIVRNVDIIAHTKRRLLAPESVASIGAFGVLSTSPHNRMKPDGVESPWLPVYDDDKNPTGTWRQDYTIRSTFLLKCPPTTRYQTVTTEYFAVLKIHGAGMGKDTSITVPLEVVSNLCRNE